MVVVGCWNRNLQYDGMTVRVYGKGTVKWLKRGEMEKRVGKQNF